MIGEHMPYKRESIYCILLHQHILPEVRLFKMRFPIGVMWSILFSEHLMETREPNAYSILDDQRNHQT